MSDRPKDDRVFTYKEKSSGSGGQLSGDINFNDFYVSFDLIKILDMYSSYDNKVEYFCNFPELEIIDTMGIVNKEKDK